MEKVRDKHRCRMAIIYVRQSTEEQARSNTGSTDYQRGQVRFAKDLGWPEELIEVIEDDLGLSGAAAGHRHGYLRIKDRIARGDIGAVFAADFTRLGRDSEEWFAFLRLCRVYDVLIIIDGKVYNASDNSELLIAKLLTTLGEYDNLQRREHLQRGRLTKARKGHTVSHPPCGYIRHREDGQWVKHPSPEVQAALYAVFRVFLEVGSCPKTVKVLRARGIKLPVHNDRGDVLRWPEPELSRVYYILRHPAYVGAYVFRRHISDPVRGRDGRGRLRMRPAKLDEQIRIDDHHDAYISKEDAQRVETLLRLNAPLPERRNIGRGGALLQGVIRCALHDNHAMTSAYNNAPRKDGGRPHSYYCIGTYHYGGQQCGNVAGLAIDHAVLNAVFERLSPPSLQAIREAFQQLRHNLRSEQHQSTFELHRLRGHEADLEFRYLNVDPSNVHVKATLESKLEQAKRDLVAAEQRLQSVPSPLDSLDDEAFDELIELCSDLPRLLKEPAITNEDRKRLLRIVIEAVFVGERTETHIHIRIGWRDGETDTLIAVPRLAYARALIAQRTREGNRPAAIVDQLNALHLLSNRGRPWTEMAVRGRIRRLRHQGLLPPAHKGGA